MNRKWFNYGVRVAIIYWVVSVIWIFGSDEILELLVKDFNEISNFQTIKGLGFVTVSALLLYFLIQYYQKLQKSIETKIIENEERQRLLIENSMDAIMVTAPDNGVILDVNPAAEKIFGWSTEEIIQGGRNLLVDLNDPSVIQALKYREEYGHFSGELNYLRKDGTIFPGEVTSSIFTDSDGNKRSSMIIRDISKRKELEKSLSESEERLRLAVTSAQQGIYDLNIQTGDVVVNDSYAEMLGYDPNTFTESVQGWMAKIHPEDVEYTTNYFNDYIQGKFDEYELEFRLRKKNGDWIWVLSLGNIVSRDEEGKPLRMLGTHTDITERKLAELEKELYSQIVEESINEIFVFDTKTYKFLQANKAAIRNSGYSLEELREMTPVEIKPRVSKDEFEQLLAPLLNGTQKQVLFETIHQRKDGSTYDVEVHVQSQKMGHESLFTAIILDITDRKRSEKIINDERRRLESIIEGTNVGTWEWNVQTGETIFNERWAEIVGYSLKELSPISIETWKQLTHPDDLKIAEEELDAHFSGKSEVYDVEIRMKHKDGQWVWIQDRGRVSEWQLDGQPLLMQGTHQDITKRKLDENKMLEQLDELRRWHKITLGREERIIELKQEINNLLIAQGEEPKYENVQL